MHRNDVVKEYIIHKCANPKQHRHRRCFQQLDSLQTAFIQENRCWSRPEALRSECYDSLRLRVSGGFFICGLERGSLRRPRVCSQVKLGGFTASASTDIMKKDHFQTFSPSKRHIFCCFRHHVLTDGFRCERSVRSDQDREEKKRLHLIFSLALLAQPASVRLDHLAEDAPIRLRPSG